MGLWNIVTDDEVLSFQKFYQAGHSTHRIAKMFGRSSSAVKKALHRAGVTMRMAKPPEALSLKQKYVACELYAGGSGAKEIATRLGCSFGTVSRAVVDAGGEMRPRGLTLWGKRDAAFRDMTPASAYWAGFIAADGCVEKDGRGNDGGGLSVNLAEKDAAHLEYLKGFLGYTGPVRMGSRRLRVIRGREVRGGDFVRLRVTSRSLASDLTEIWNVTPRKSLTLKFPLGIPHELNSHFIRGFADGDGHISKIRDGSRHVAITLCSASEAFLRGCRDSIGRTGCLSRKAETMWQLTYTGLRQVCEILRYLYAGSTAETRLARKYERVVQIWKRESQRSVA